jgi:hypothetical protein
MWEWLSETAKSGISSLSDADTLKGIGSVVGGLGQAYGAYKQADMASNMFKLQKMDYLDQKKKEEETKDAFAKAFGGDLTPKLTL